jgi:PAS domain S-box-containing protein
MTDAELPPSLFTAILQQSADAIVYADREGRIAFWNRAAERLFGFTAEQVLGQSLDVMIPERLRAGHWAGYDKAMASGTTVHSGRAMLTKALRPSGEAVYVEMSFAVVDDPQTGRRGSVAIAREAKPRER